MFVLSDTELLSKMTTNAGQSLASLSHKKPVLLIFLRHLGCMFCKEALSDLAKIRSDIEKIGTQIVLIHMAEEEVASDFFDRYNLPNVFHISDVERQYYKGFGLANGELSQLFGFGAFLGMGRAMSKGNIPSAHIGDSHQMPGVFLLHKAKIVKSFLYKSIGQRPNYLNMATLA